MVGIYLFFCQKGTFCFVQIILIQPASAGRFQETEKALNYHLNKVLNIQR